MALNNKEKVIQYKKVHRILAEGNFIFCMSEGKIVEHWNTTNPVAPKIEWKNNNGKF